MMIFLVCATCVLAVLVIVLFLGAGSIVAQNKALHQINKLNQIETNGLRGRLADVSQELSTLRAELRQRGPELPAIGDTAGGWFVAKPEPHEKKCVEVHGVLTGNRTMCGIPQDAMPQGHGWVYGGRKGAITCLMCLVVAHQ